MLDQCIQKIDLACLEDTIDLGKKLAKKFYQNQVIALSGNLGAGKTTFVQGVLKGLEINDLAQSPTFSLLHIYQGILPVFHFDLYRLKSTSEFISLGFEEYFEAGGVCLIEWAERIESILPKNHLRIQLEHAGQQRVASLWV